MMSNYSFGLYPTFRESSEQALKEMTQAIESKDPEQIINSLNSPAKRMIELVQNNIGLAQKAHNLIKERHPKMAATLKTQINDRVSLLQREEARTQTPEQLLLATT